MRTNLFAPLLVVLLACSATALTPEFIFKQHVNNLWTGLLQQNAAAIVSGAAPVPDVFTDDALGRTHPISHSFDKNHSIEYLFSITANEFSGVNVTKFSLQNWMCSGERCSGKVILHFTNHTGYTVANITLMTQYRFSTSFWEGYKIAEYEFAALDLDLFWKQLGLDFENPVVQDNLIAQICYVHENFCTGSLKQYANYTDCVYVHKYQLKFGHPSNFLDRSVVCHQIHAGMAVYYPQDHCVHISYEGGGRCREYTSTELHAPLFNSGKRLIY